MTLTYKSTRIHPISVQGHNFFCEVRLEWLSWLIQFINAMLLVLHCSEFFLQNQDKCAFEFSA